MMNEHELSCLHRGGCVLPVRQLSMTRFDISDTEHPPPADGEVAQNCCRTAGGQGGVLTEAAAGVRHGLAKNAPQHRAVKLRLHRCFRQFTATASG